MLEDLAWICAFTVNINTHLPGVFVYSQLIQLRNNGLVLHTSTASGSGIDHLNLQYGAGGCK
jgi:hypothetical protein